MSSISKVVEMFFCENRRRGQVLTFCVITKVTPRLRWLFLAYRRLKITANSRSFQSNLSLGVQVISTAKIRSVIIVGRRLIYAME